MANVCPCGASIPVPIGRSRPRKYCTTCRPPVPKAKQTAPILALRPSPSAATPSGDLLLLEAATRAELFRVERHETTRGIAALTLARLIDAGGYNAQGAAALVKAHREALDLALEGTTETADVIDAIFGASG